jgi:hypothetical protein
MTVPTNTLQTYQSTNNAEDVSDIINNISPADTPLYSMAAKKKADAMYTEWLVESLAAADGTNANIEGDDASTDASTTPTRVGNYCQIVDKVFQVSTTQDAIHKYGVGKEFEKQKAKKGLELRRDMETIMLQNQARVVGAASTAQKMRSLPAWYATNDNRGVGGADGSTSAAATDGTQRAFSEALFRSTLVTAITNANDLPSVVMAGPANRANLSTQLSGSATRYYEVADGKLNASISVYRSDYGPLKFVMNRFQRERDMHFINPDLIAVRTLEPLSYHDLAKTGLSRRGQMFANFTLEVSNEAGHAVLADLLTAVI